jgi:SAM-dependent methyltransferase
MPENTDRDYVLGTHDDEISRLGLQHRVWRSIVLETWRRAGIRSGSHVLDVGAGPGFATLDLAEIVGPSGHVAAAERSGRFLGHLRAHAAARGLANVSAHETDLMVDALPPCANREGYDAVWCRWVASFVSDPERLVRKIAAALRPGGAAIFHEYVHYETYALLPHGPRTAEFVQHVMRSWRDTGGEPNVAPRLLAAFGECGLRVRESTPISFAAGPEEERWLWPTSYIEVGSERLRDLGRVSAEWVEAVRTEVAEAAGNPTSRITTPTVLEVVVERV